MKMIALNLAATTSEQVILKNYFESEMSEMLAEKINNGVYVEKDGKRLLNKKDLVSYLKYVYDEARKQAEKGAQFACLDCTTLLSIAVHYFEEDSIEGTLYNEDGTEYKSVPKQIAAPTQRTPIVAPAKPVKLQKSFFDEPETSIPETEPERQEGPGSEELEESEPPKPKESSVLQTLFGNVMIAR
jgi:hypothetical protein